MQAKVGDRLVIKGHTVGDPDRDAEILEVRGAGGAPPYTVRWSEDGHTGLFFPGPDAVVEHLATKARSKKRSPKMRSPMRSAS